MRTLLAIMRDTMLSLVRRRLFWLHFWISAAVVLLYAGIACDGDGWSIGFGLKDMQSTWLRKGTPWENTLHCWSLTRVMRWWVAGGSLFLALFATAAVLPETLEPGSAALLVPRARRRSVILAGRFIGSLLYGLLHTVLCVGGLWLVVRWRLGIWYHPMWLAVPVALLLFAPLQAVAMLLGVLTRSAAAALLVAILFAGSVWALQEATLANDSAAREESAAPEEEDNGSGMSYILSSEVLQCAAQLLPQSRDSLLWMERRACPRPQRSYRELFRRLRVGHTGLGAVAAEAIASASGPPIPKKAADTLSLAPLMLSSAGFTIGLMAAASWLLSKRDL